MIYKLWKKIILRFLQQGETPVDISMRKQQSEIVQLFKNKQKVGDKLITKNNEFFIQFQILHAKDAPAVKIDKKLKSKVIFTFLRLLKSYSNL